MCLYMIFQLQTKNQPNKMETKRKRKRIKTKKGSEPILVYSTSRNTYFNGTAHHKTLTKTQNYAK